MSCFVTAMLIFHTMFDWLPQKEFFGLFGSLILPLFIV